MSNSDPSSGETAIAPRRKALAVSDWFKAHGGETPDAWMDLFSEILVSDEPPTEQEIARTHELAAKYGWEKEDATDA